MTIENFLSNSTEEAQQLAKMPWQKVVDEVILPQLAGRAEQRNRIGAGYMKFCAEFARDIFRKDNSLAEVLFEIAMQRISNGAVLHPMDPPPTFDALPPKYREYASQNGYQGGEPGLMEPECYDFCIKALPLCVEIPNLRKHAIAIAFGILQYLNEKGKPQDDYYFGTVTYKPDGVQLYILTKQLVEKECSFEELFRHYAQPKQWQKHQKWFAEAYKKGKLNWKEFFKQSKADGEGNFFKRYKQRRQIKAEILQLIFD